MHRRRLGAMCTSGGHALDRAFGLTTVEHCSDWSLLAKVLKDDPVAGCSFVPPKLPTVCISAPDCECCCGGGFVKDAVIADLPVTPKCGTVERSLEADSQADGLVDESSPGQCRIRFCRLLGRLLLATGSADYVVERLIVSLANVGREFLRQVLRADEPSACTVPGGGNDSKQERFQFLNGPIVDREIDAETVPTVLVPIVQVLLETDPQIRGEPHIVKLAFAIEGVDAMPPADVFADDVLIVFQCRTRDVLQVLRDNLGCFWQSIASYLSVTMVTRRWHDSLYVP